MVPEERFSAALENFVAVHVGSVVTLEALMLLRSSRPRVWSAGALSRELRIDGRSAAGELDALLRAGLIESADPASYRYATHPPEREAILEELERAYAQRRVSLVGLIYAAPRDPARDFAEAFRVRKEPSDG